jgi:hypothetical protein
MMKKIKNQFKDKDQNQYTAKYLEKDKNEDKNENKDKDIAKDLSLNKSDNSNLSQDNSNFLENGDYKKNITTLKEQGNYYNFKPLVSFGVDKNKNLIKELNNQEEDKNIIKNYGEPISDIDHIPPMDIKTENERKNICCLEYSEKFCCIF